MNVKQVFGAIKQSPLAQEVGQDALHALEASGTQFLSDVQKHVPSGTAQGLAVQAILASLAGLLSKTGG